MQSFDAVPRSSASDAIGLVPVPPTDHHQSSAINEFRAISHASYVCQRDEEIAEVHARAILLKHRSGLQLLVLRSPDPSMTFGLSIATPAQDDSGATHLLEHLVLAGKLCGVGAFNEHTRASPAIEANACTEADYTLYYFSTPHPEDFRIWTEIYLGGLFNPPLGKEEFAADCCRIERVEKTGANGTETQYRFNGAAYSEMKDYCADPLTLHDIYVRQHLFPDTHYRFNFAGLPLEIARTNVAKLRQVYEQFYHPASMRVFLYINDTLDITSILEYLDQQIPPALQAKVCNLPLQMQEPFSAPRRVTAEFPGGETEVRTRDALVSVSWAFAARMDFEQRMLLSVLSDALLHDDSSPLRRVMLESNLGDSIIDDGYFDCLAQHGFTIGFDGASSDKSDEIEALILSCLRECAENGLSAQVVSQALEEVENQVLDHHDSSNRGERLLTSTIEGWHQGIDPIDLHRALSHLSALKQKLAEDPSILGETIRKLFLDNPHRLLLTMTPNRSLIKKQETEETECVEAAISSMTQQDLDAELELSDRIRAESEPNPDPDLIDGFPHLKLSQFSKSPPQRQGDWREEPCPILLHPCNELGFSYITLALNLRPISQEIIPYVGIYLRLIGQLGAGPDPYQTFLPQVAMFARNLQVEFHLARERDSNEIAARALISAHARHDRVERLMPTMRKAIVETNLDDRERVLDVLRRLRTEAEDDFLPAGTTHAMFRAAAHKNPLRWIEGQLEGIEYYYFLRGLISEARDSWRAVLAKLTEARSALFSAGQPMVSIVAPQDQLQTMSLHLAEFVRPFVGVSSCAAQWIIPELPRNEGFTLPARGRFVGMSLDLKSVGYSRDAAFDSVLRHLKYSSVWNRFRESGGAYGMEISLDSRSGILNVGSYRHPSVLRTVESISRIPIDLRALKGRDYLRRSIIGVLGELDAPKSPLEVAQELLGQRIQGDSPEHILQDREQVFETGVKHYKQLADLMELALPNATVVALGARHRLEKANRLRGEEWLTIRRLI